MSAGIKEICREQIQDFVLRYIGVIRIEATAPIRTLHNVSYMLDVW